MAACQYPGCLVELPPRKGRGRPAEFCPDHAKARKQEQDKARRLNSRESETISEGKFPCCLEWRKAGRGNRTTCPQHKQLRASKKQTLAALSSVRRNGEPAGNDGQAIASLSADGVGFSVRADPDSWKPVDRDDKAQDKALAEWIDAGMPGAAARIPEEVTVMPYSPVEQTAFQFRQEDVDNPDCERLTNGLWAENTDPPHCQRCANLIRACIPRPYQVYDYLGRPIVSDAIEVA